MMRVSTGGEPLALLPGTLCDGRVYGPLLERLAPDHARPVLTPVTDGAETAADAAALLLRGLPPRFALAGFSLGGIVALEMIAQAPERVTRLALIDTTARPDPPANRAIRRNAVARAAAMGLDRYVGDKLWSLYAADAGRTRADLKALVEAMAADAGIDRFRRQSEIAINRTDSRPRLARIDAPALVLCGAHDKLCPPEVHLEMAALIPGATLVVVSDAGHFAIIEQPDAVARAFEAWLTAPENNLTRDRA